MINVDFYLTVSSRYTYLAMTQLDRIAREHRCSFTWKPVNNHELLARRGYDPFKTENNTSGQYDWAYREYDAKCWAKFYGVPFVEPINFRRDPIYLVNSCYAAEQCGYLEAFCRRLSEAIFVESRVIVESDINSIAKEVGIDPVEFENAYNSDFPSDRFTELHDEAARRKVFGVPTFVLREKMFWGNDRLRLLEWELQQLADDG
ncbi:MAG: DsbA family protein [Pseudomonadota bacterium]